MAVSASRRMKTLRNGGSSGNWIQGAIKKPGALKQALHVPKDKEIPASKLKKAMHSKSPIMRKRAALAKTLKGFSKRHES